MATYWQEHSLSIAPQVSGFGVVNSTDLDFKHIQGDKPKVQFATEITEIELMTGQIGAAPERLIGRRHGTIGFSMPLEGLKVAFNPAAELLSEPDVLPPWIALVGNSLGSYITNTVDTAEKFWGGTHLSLSTYIAAGMASGTATTIVTDADPETFEAGQLAVASASATSTSPQIGFIKTLDTGTKTLTLWDAAANNLNSAAANIYGTATAWLSPVFSSQLPLTMRWRGERTEACYILQDCVCTSVKLTWESGAVPTVEFAFNFYEYTVDKTLGSLQTPVAFQRIPQIVGANNGRVMLGKTTAGVFGSAVQCGLESCTWEYKSEISELKCHSSAQGISGVTYRKPRINVACSIPWTTADEVRNSAGTAGTAGSHLWQSILELGQTLSLCVYVGTNVGRFFAFHVPAGKLVAVPQVTELNGTVGYQLQIEAGAYTGDTSSHAATTTQCPIDSLCKVAVG